MQAFIDQHRNDSIEQLALQRQRYSQWNDTQWRWILQQIEGWQRTQDKLPEIASLSDWWYPVRLSLEQCSSELTARYKAALIQQAQLEQPKLIDMTGGMGVDCYYMAQSCQQAVYCERDQELCRLAEHNFQRYSTIPIAVRNEEIQASTILSNDANIVYLDPARRDKNGGKVYRIEDCEPNVLTLLPNLVAHAQMIIIKLSPMLDITAALRSLGGVWDVKVVAVKNEVKEILLIQYLRQQNQPTIEAIDLYSQQSFTFTRTHEEEATPIYASQLGQYLYEPNAAILKAGAYKVIGQQFGIAALGVNTHLYTSDTLIHNWQGRTWRIVGIYDKHNKTKKWNVLTRNYVLGAEALKRQLHIQDGGKDYLIGTRIGNQPMLIIGEIM